MNASNPYPCHRYRPQPHSRREMLARCGSGFAAVAMAALSRDKAFAVTASEGAGLGFAGHGFAGHGTHHPAKAKQVIFLYMDGGPSQVDTFDPKPMLDKFNGEDPGQFFNVEPTQFNNNGKVLASPWKFNQYGDAGIPISDLFPHIATCADELTVVRSMVSEFPEHTFANYFLHTGSGLQGRPSMGAWVNYGLGSECEDLPGFVALNGGLIPPGGLDCFGSGFLPASYQGSVFKPSGSAVANITPTEKSSVLQRNKLDLIRDLDNFANERFGSHDSLESAIRNYELAFQMQMAVPELMSLDEEPAYIRTMYGMDSEYKPTQIYAAECLIAQSLGRARSSLRRTYLPASRRRPLGPTRQVETRSRKQRASSRSTHRRIVKGFTATRDAR